MQPNLDDDQRAEGPKEDAQKVLSDDMLPKVFLDDVFARRGNEPHYVEADDGEDEVHPILVENIHLSMDGFLVLMFQHAESQSHNEQNHAEKQGNALRTGLLQVAEGGFFWMLVALLIFLMDLVAFFAAFVMMVGVGLGEFVHQKSHNDSYCKQHYHQYQSFFGNYGEHDKGFIALRGNHHGNQRTEAQ